MCLNFADVLESIHVAPATGGIGATQGQTQALPGSGTATNRRNQLQGKAQLNMIIGPRIEIGSIARWRAKKL